MDALRIGGIVSGMDTNSIVEKLTSQAKIPLQNLQAKYDLKVLEKSVYTEISDKLKTIKADLLNLRLESTFKNNVVTSTNSSILTATVTPSASTGSHLVRVDQTAKNSYSYSQYTMANVMINSVGVTAISGRPVDFNEGVHSVNIYENSGTYISEDTFKFNELGIFNEYKGSNNVSNINSNGNFTASATGTLTVSIDSVSYTLNATINNGDDINIVTKQLEDSINSQLNTNYDTSNIQYFSVRGIYSSGNWKIAFYNTSTDNLSFSLTGGTLQSDLGLTTTTTSSVNEMKKYHVASSLTDLKNKINDSNGGLIPGVTFTASSFTTGTMTIAQDASLKVSAATYTTIYSADPSSGPSINTTVTGLQNAGFSTMPSSLTNGTFTINGKKITINDYTSISVDTLLAQINSSGAGVVATYNPSTDQFELRSTTKGATTISLGDYSDTSNILSILKLTSASGAQTVTGKTAGTIDPAAKLNQSGMTSTPTSGTFTINGVSIYVDVTNDSLNDVITKINNSGANVKVSYDSVRDKINIISTSGINKITFGSSNDTSNFLVATNLTDSQTTTKSIGYGGQYALLNVDGINYTRSTNSIDDIIQGVTLNIKTASSETVTIDVTVDPSKAINYLATFTKHYNEMMEKLTPPELKREDKEYLVALTDEKKASMSAEEVKSYEEKWKTFNTYEIIRKSSEFRQLKSSLRAGLFSNLTGITGKYSNLSDIGLKVAGEGNIEILKKGFLVSDSTDIENIKSDLNSNSKLIEAITRNSEDVFKLFSQNTTSGKGWTRVYDERIGNFVNFDGLIYNKIKPYGTIDRQTYTLIENMDKEQKRVENYFERMWAAFSNMESTIAKLQEKGNALSGILASFNK
ncbi:MAG: flagellar filament capping protein FliD [Calditerrivibrio sp.]|nr:flagellar filament capping protein FliD [Calditerrivibrio sp.]MCA1932901.1 flagellar filament capping protein FliD [Calditerrivibrio sp.]MCA1980597.1 flagellar filament capping protein FliD [Calditerrivibrio sp.]